MIIFDLDGTLANCEHRRHFVDMTQSYDKGFLPAIEVFGHQTTNEQRGGFYHKETKQKWKPNWKDFYEECDKDEPIKPVLDAFIHLTQGEPFNHDVQIWSGRCESVREKTLKWLCDLTGYCEDYQYWDRRLKMRPIGDYTPDDELKEKWLDEYMFEEKCKYKTLQYAVPLNTVEFVFDDRPKVVKMWRRRGIFVFNCCQHNEEF